MHGDNLTQIKVANPNQVLIDKQLRRMAQVEFVQKYGALIILAVLFLLNAVYTNNFLTKVTMCNLLVQVAPVALVALGMTFVIATGGIDISSGACMAMSGMVTTMLMEYIGIFPAIFLGLVAAGLVGVVNGFAVSKFGIQPTIATLATMIGARGLAQILTPGGLYYFSNDAYSRLSLEFIGEIPIQFFYLLVLFFIFSFIAYKTVFGRYVEAIGDNFKAAALSGVKASFYLIIVYILSAVMAGMAGILITARTSSCDGYNIGLNYEMDAIAAVAIGGTALTGGKPRVIGTIVGSMIIQIVYSMVIMNDLRYEYSLVVKALIIILAAAIQRKKSKD